MRKAGAIDPVTLEPLEGRTLMSGEPWGAFPQLIEQDSAVANFPTITGAGYSVAVLDTGIDYRHPGLGGGFGPGYKVIAGYDFVDNDADPNDPNGHGTAVASVIAADPFVHDGCRYQGVAPDANLIALRTDDGSDVPNGARIEAALQWVIAHRTQYNIVAINISTGDGHYSSEQTQAPYGDELATLAGLGVFICASSGNDGVQWPYGIEYPAADPSVYAIGSVNVNDRISTFTERGANMDLLAPGEDVPVLIFRATDHEYITWQGSGTSFASPFAAGAAVLLRQIDQTLTPAQIMAILQNSGVSNYDGDSESAPTTGLTFRRLDLNAAMEMAASDDAWEDNDTRAAATALTLISGHASLTNLRLLGGDPDYFRFSISALSDVSATAHAGSSLDVHLLAADGSDLGSAASVHRLEAGTYYLRLSSATTVSGTYRIDLAASVVVVAGPPVFKAAVSSMAYDKFGNLHLAYYDSAARNLKYAVRSADGEWSDPVVVDAQSGAGQHLSLAVDKFGRAGIAYYNGSDLKYAHWNGSAWEVSSVDTAGWTGLTPSLAYKGATPGISYYDKTRGDLRFATFTAAWVCKSLDKSAGKSAPSAIIYNAAKKAFALACVRAIDGMYRYGAQSAATGKWAFSNIDDTKSGGGHISLALDNSNRPAFSYYDSYKADLKYAWYTGSAWKVTTVASSGYQGTFSTLRFTADNKADILFYNKSANAIYAATGSAGAWSIKKIRSAAGLQLAAATDPTTGDEAYAWLDTSESVLQFNSR